MDSTKVLWFKYHQAIKAGETEKAKRILRTLQNYTGKGNPSARPTRGCAKCNRRFG